MKGKIYNVEEANRMLPLVSRIAEDLMTGYGEVTAALQAYEAAKSAAARGPEAQVALLQSDVEVSEALRRFQDLVEEVESLGGTVKDYEHGLIDFYGDVAGEIVYLCWRPGEGAITHFHRLDEGYAMRRALPAALGASPPPPAVGVLGRDPGTPTRARLLAPAAPPYTPRPNAC